MANRRPLVQVPGSGSLFTLEELRGTDRLELAGLGINGWGGLYDTNGNALLLPVVAANAVNYGELQNAATGFAPRWIANGSDSTVDFLLVPKGSAGRAKVRVSGANYELWSALLFAAKGDLVLGTGSAAAAVLTVGTNGQTLVADSTQSAGAAWKWHPVDLVFHAIASSQATWTDMPSAETLFQGSHRHVVKFDATGFTQARLQVVMLNTAGASGAKLIARYGTSFSTAASGYTTDVGTSEVSCAINVTNSHVVSSWVDLASGAKGDNFFAIVGSGGDGAIDPQHGTVRLQFR